MHDAFTVNLFIILTNIVSDYLPFRLWLEAEVDLLLGQILTPLVALRQEAKNMGMPPVLRTHQTQRTPGLSSKTIDSNEVKLVLQKETLAMFFDQLLANGRLDKEAAKELSKKYHMSDENYAQLSPPTLSSTKLHMIQSYDVGGVYNRLLTIHTHHRSALKIFLRVYGSLGGTSQTFSDYLPVVSYNEDGAVNERFVLPSKQDLNGRYWFHYTTLMTL